MESIIPLLTIIVSLFALLLKGFRMPLFDLLEIFFDKKNPTRVDLWYSYGMAAVLVFLLNLFVLLVRAVNYDMGGSFLPTIITRTPMEWTVGAMISSLLILQLFCFWINDYYNHLRDGSYLFSDRYKKKWAIFYGINLVVGIAGYCYKGFFYGWGLNPY